MNNEDEKILYCANFAYEIPGFYSDDDDNEGEPHSAPDPHRESHVSIRLDQQSSSSSTGRKRSGTNSFTGRPFQSSVHPAEGYNSALSSTMQSVPGQNEIGNISHTLQQAEPGSRN